MSNPYRVGQVVVIKYPKPLPKEKQYVVGHLLDIVDMSTEECIAKMEVKKSNRYRVCGVIVNTYGHKRRNGK